jgi:hypothetical protein
MGSVRARAGLPSAGSPTRQLHGRLVAWPAGIGPPSIDRSKLANRSTTSRCGTRSWKLHGGERTTKGRETHLASSCPFRLSTRYSLPLCTPVRLPGSLHGR